MGWRMAWRMALQKSACAAPSLARHWRARVCWVEIAAKRGCAQAARSVGDDWYGDEFLVKQDDKQAQHSMIFSQQTIAID